MQRGIFLKGIDQAIFIFGASAKTNCWILELCIWLVSKLIGLPLLQRTPHQSKAEACYRQITYFQKKTFVRQCAKTISLRTSRRIYIIYETHKMGIALRVLIYGSFLSADSSVCQKEVQKQLFSRFPNIYQVLATINKICQRYPHSTHLN